jgi:lipid II:glycine glycyltransferase (peptidoglycan interpeptide bridge formation enzyme)
VSLPFSDHCDPLVDSTEQLETLLTHIKVRVKQERWKYFEIRPVSSEPNGHADLSRMVNYYFHNLDLRPTTEQLFHNFHRDCIQRKIRRAERERLQYEEGTSEELLLKFYRLLVMTRRRQYLPPQPLAWFRGLIAAFGADLQIRVASKDGMPVASILTLSHKKTMVYKYGCSNVAFNNLGGTPFLFWRTIQEAKDRGCEQLEMGRSDMDNQGLVAFKERLGASRRSISYWRYPQVDVYDSGRWRISIAKRAVRVMPDLALKTIGKLLYRHIG